MRRFLLLFIAVNVLLLNGNTALGQGAKPKLFSLEDLVARSDFVGIVECETAGVVVAKYKVIESCRGAKAGATIYVRISESVGRELAFASTCGERYLITAARTDPAFPRGKPINGKPLSWRQLHADYEGGFGGWPAANSENMNDRYAEAKNLVAAQRKAEVPLAKPGPDIVWKGPPMPPVTPARLGDWRRTTVTGPRMAADFQNGWPYAYEPTPFFERLVTWKPMLPPTLERLAPTSAYRAGSYNAFRCGQDRKKHLSMLLDAKEPIVRVAGAVYLCFEDEKLGMAELAKLTKLEDEAGVWAALTLARRGQKDAVPRLLDTFRIQDRHRKTFHTDLCFHALTLFSNSAQKSGVSQPPRRKNLEIDSDAIQVWWRDNSAKITLHDPWMETLSKQKID